MSQLFEPIKVGQIELKNRIIMSPLTRCRASEGRVPNDLMVEYYTQRASAGLIISEATSIEPMGVGYPDTPGIWSDEQVEGWKKITKAVHDKGGKIVLQLWHVGRISDPVYLNGAQPVAPSAIAAQGHVSLVRPTKEFEKPRALETNEIKDIIKAYRLGAQNAKKAGFDGVEIHGANGYLPDQFLQSSTNQRDDEYGGSLENRARFLLEATDAAIDAWGAGRVGVHLSPRCDAHDMGDSNPSDTFAYVAKALAEREIAFIFTREHFNEPGLTAQIKKQFGGTVIGNEALTKAQAEELIKNDVIDAAAFGKDYIANPDLVERLEQDAKLNALNTDTMYGSGKEGYTDYPFLD
ncbi:alkene reductase [Marinomonas flavescens]|uniref:alkene reductase n=1 Tax=Marinomonas flavescens TaxID=2529379 RepID=UPI001055EACE|nr:alkene reductase [Marinomonas flavescens]